MRILLTGGSAHGKSTYAETLANRFALPRYFIDTTGPSAEVGRRSERMLRLRADGRFTVLERGADLQQIRLPLRGVVLLDCMCHLTANEMFDQTGEIRDAHDIILMGIESLAARSEVLIVVSTMWAPTVVNMTTRPARISSRWAASTTPWRSGLTPSMKWFAAFQSC